MKDIGFVTSGDGAQLQCYADYQRYLDAQLYLRHLDRVDLGHYRAIVIPDFSNQDLLRRHARQISDYLAHGGFLIVFEPNRMDEWLDVVEVQWFERETENWKWWMKPGGRMEAYQPEPRHPMAKAIPLADMCWHFFGAFRLPADAEPILNLDNDEGCLMYDQRVGDGRLIAATIDPHTHHGRRFMPATTRFLNGFYPWLKAELCGRDEG
ncbi:hypothetical protein G5V57_12200 [Nordella sp. HKS 07]|uniref:hypothetical protein n=1 Tax=Nordella sp. HKS 07 TaxID=2712222 RepID=UPI0013E0F46A|nr:hypothetical protein [Nordella sp. HKS 07]QIG48418.1 hypothetical protein G5V57_12200 [Nordella sp. HKS 07]